MTLPFCQRDMAQVAFSWVPWSLNITASGKPWGWLCLPGPGDRVFNLNLGADPDNCEVEAWRWGPLCVTRLMTAQEAADYEDAQAEEAFMAHELHRYTEWSY